MNESEYYGQGVYEIKVKGHINEQWSHWFEGLTITSDYEEDNGPVTILTGRIEDQAALHGVLAKIRDINMPLISVNRIKKSEHKRRNIMQTNTSTSQKIGWVVFIIGALYMFGLGWLYSWRMVPAAYQIGPEALAGMVGFLWALSVPLGAFIVALGAALIAQVEKRVFWLLILLIVLFTAWRIAGTTSQMVPALFGVGGGLITLFFVGSVWHWASTRPTLSGLERTGSDLRMVGFVFFVVAAWDLCGLFGMANFVLRPELADKFGVPLGSTIDSASGVLVLLALGWGFTYFGQLKSRQAQAVEAEAVPQVAAAD